MRGSFLRTQSPSSYHIKHHTVVSPHHFIKLKREKQACQKENPIYGTTNILREKKHPPKNIIVIIIITMSSIFSNIANTSSSPAYTNVRLVEDRTIDLYLYHSKGNRLLWSNDQWLEEGRPRELATLNLATWSLLTTSIKQYQTGLRRNSAKIAIRLLVPIYFVWLLSIIFLDSSYGINFTESEPFMILLFYGSFILYIFGALMYSRKYRNQYAIEHFHPAIETVLTELQQSLLDTGYQVEYIVQQQESNNNTSNSFWWLWCCQPPSKGFLRFIPLPDQEVGKDATASTTTRGQLKWQSSPIPIVASE